MPEVPDSIHGSATYFRCPSADSRRVGCWRNYVHLVLVNRLEVRDFSLPRNSVGSSPCTFAPPRHPLSSHPLVRHKTLKYIINTVIRERRRCRVVKDAFLWCRKSPENREMAPRLRHQLSLSTHRSILLNHDRFRLSSAVPRILSVAKPHCSYGH